MLTRCLIIKSIMLLQLVMYLKWSSDLLHVLSVYTDYLLYCVLLIVEQNIVSRYWYFRNLSSAKQSNRQAMRKCQGLINSLVRYVKKCVEAGKPDDKVNTKGVGGALVSVFRCSLQSEFTFHALSSCGMSTKIDADTVKSTVLQPTGQVWRE